MPKYKLKGGSYATAGSGDEVVEVKRGEVFCTEDPVCDMWPDMWEPVHDDTPAVNDPVDEVESTDDGDDAGDGEGSPGLGEDVTDQFDAAEEAGVYVFKEGRKYSVADGEDLTDPLFQATTKKAVNEFIASLEGDDE